MDNNKNELDEMVGANMDTRAIHRHLRKRGWELTRTSGSHDVFEHPDKSHHISVPRHKQLKAPLVKDIIKLAEESIEESIPKHCWSGYRKVGTKPGTGRNAGKRVNDCEKIKEEVMNEVSKGPSPGWMLRADPELRKKAREKILLARKRISYMGKTSDEIAKMKNKAVSESGPFSYGSKAPRKGTVAYNAMMKRKMDKTPPIEPKDQMVGNAKVIKAKVAEARSLYKMDDGELEAARVANEKKISSKGRVTKGDRLMDRRRTINLIKVIRQRQGSKDQTGSDKK